MSTSTAAQCFLAAFFIAFIVALYRSIPAEQKQVPRHDQFTAWGDI